MMLRTGLIALILVTGALAWKGPENPKWWQHGVIYQVYPRSYKDWNGDGIGDLKGIKSQLPYLKDLGITALWLSPICPSPQADFGYDISNFVDVDPVYGTLEDFDDLVKEAHKIGLKVVMDLVPNHTSDEHTWFLASSDPSHPEHQKYKDYFMWVAGNPKKPPNNWLSVFRGPAWTFHPKRKMWYMHQFLPQQPDLNFRNAGVVEDMKNVIRFWMKRGVDGFRVDAIPFLFEDAKLRNEKVSGWTDDKDDRSYFTHDYLENLNETYDMIEQWRAVIDEDKEVDRVMMGEAYCPLEETMRYFGTKEKPGCHFPFNFYFITDLKQGANSTLIKTTIEKWMNEMKDDRWPNWVIGNHDNKRIGTRLGTELIDAMNMISMSLPGTAMTYNGDEIGMTDNFIRWEDTLDPQAIRKGKDRYLEVTRDGCRTPMQWDDSTAAGFSKNATTWLPVNPNYWQVNVKKEKSGRTHYNVYRRIIEARKTPTMRKGDVKVSEADGGVLLIERTLENHPPFILAVNLGTKETEWKHADLNKMKVFASSLNSGYNDDEKTKETLLLRPQAAYLLTTNNSMTSRSSILTMIGALTLIFTFTKNLF